MITTIKNTNKELVFHIDNAYRVLINKRTSMCDIFLLTLDVDLFEHLLSVEIFSFNMKRLPLVLTYLKSSSEVMEGNDVNRRLLRMFLLIVEG